MIVPFARAVQGFISVADTPNLASTDNFIQCLQKILTFESIDIQDFDGNTCRIISSEDPTNSIFIYTNDTGTYLYQVVKASPVLHKNKKIWLCDTYEMEDVAKINDILTRNTKVICYKNCFANTSSSPVPTEEKISIKDNFLPREIEYYDVFGDKLCLKIKCMTNPTTENLTSYAADGSFNFFFPIKIKDNHVTQVIRKYGDLTQYVKLSELMSKYSPNIKSVEIIPYVPAQVNTEMSVAGLLPVIRRIEDTGTVGEISVEVAGTGAVWTDCGIFLPQGHSNHGNNASVSQSAVAKILYYNKQILQGGGARGFLRTPLGNIELDFTNCTMQSYTGGGAFEVFLLEDGWKIDGIAFKCKVPPHYLNFYTDNAGQVFIQNLTTNAQELRSLERQNIAKQEEQQQSYVYGQVTNALETAATATQKFAKLDLLGGASAVAQGAMNAGMLAVENEFNKAKIDREYGRSLAEYRDKISTQSLLASLTGKQISGNVSLPELIKAFKCNYFKLFIETNFSIQLLSSGSKFSFLTQPDYDYSSSALPASNYLPNTNQIENWNCIYKTSNTVADVMGKLFGYSGIYADNVGLSYDIVFSLENAILAETELASFNFSRKMHVPIRRNKKMINYS